MAKRITIDGKHYRRRHGKLVEIPEEWVGHVTHKQTRMKRQSKQIKKLTKRRRLKPGER